MGKTVSVFCAPNRQKGIPELQLAYWLPCIVCVLVIPRHYSLSGGSETLCNWVPSQNVASVPFSSEILDLCVRSTMGRDTWIQACFKISTMTVRNVDHPFACVSCEYGVITVFWHNVGWGAPSVISCTMIILKHALYVRYRCHSYHPLTTLGFVPTVDPYNRYWSLLTILLSW